LAVTPYDKTQRLGVAPAAKNKNHRSGGFFAETRAQAP